MEQSLPHVKSCPVCGVAMVRVSIDAYSVIFHCYSCNLEIVKQISRDTERRRVPSRERRLAGYSQQP